jgi:hypothetical protein
MAAASLLEPKACAILTRSEPRLHDGPDFRQRYLERLLLLPNVGIHLSATGCALMACLEAAFEMLQRLFW